MISKKLTMKKIHIAWLISAAVLGLIAAGCGLIEPEDLQKKANQPPETTITSGPRSNTTISYFVRIAWKGEDQDGQVQGFNLVVDGSQTYVTKTDSTFVFSAANQSTPHSISVAAVDDRGDADPSPASLSFTAENAAPNTSIKIENGAPGATFGRGALVIIRAHDPDNGPEFNYRYKIDANGQWSDWLADSVVTFSSASKFGLLPEGAHTLFAQVRDNAQAVDQTPAEFRFTSSATVKPSVTLQPLKNSAPFYSDSSAFSTPSGNTVSFAWAPVFNYSGGISSGSRYRIDGGAWTAYSTAVSALQLTNVAVGAHTLDVQYIDLGGATSDILTFKYEIVAATLNAGILVVDDGNGSLANRPLGATGDVNADNFYRDVLSGVGATRVANWDVTTQGIPTPKKGFGKYSTIIWRSDEATFSGLPRQVQLAGEYLTLGGKMWIAGWRAVNQFAGTQPFPNFEPNANSEAGVVFVWNFLKLRSLRQTPGTLFDFTGVTGLAGHPNANVDAAKNPIPGRAGLAPIDVYTLRSNVAGLEAIYTFNSATGNVDFQGAITGVKYLGTDFKVVVFGFPFYHMKLDEAKAVATKILQDLGEI
jgi:hypothetical protein